jgi:thiol-disulfide isomerase/thioredoxin
MQASMVWAKSDVIVKPVKPLPALAGPAAMVTLDSSDIVIYQFWASWCTGCGTVMAQIGKTLQAFPKAAYVSVSLDETKEIALKFFANKPEAAAFALQRSYLDESGKYFAEPSKVESLPYLIITKKDGTVIKRFKGHPSQGELDRVLKQGS